MMILCCIHFKVAVSPDIRKNVRFYKIKSVREEGPLMVFKFSNVVVPMMIRNWLWNCFYQKSLLIFLNYSSAVIKDFPKAASAHIKGFLTPEDTFWRSQLLWIPFIEVNTDRFMKLFRDCASDFLNPLNQ